jgi:hypothetical protein
MTCRDDVDSNDEDNACNDYPDEEESSHDESDLDFHSNADEDEKGSYSDLSVFSSSFLFQLEKNEGILADSSLCSMRGL